MEQIFKIIRVQITPSAVITKDWEKILDKFLILCHGCIDCINLAFRPFHPINSHTIVCFVLWLVIFHGKRIEDVFADVDTPYRKVRRCLIGGVTVLYEPPEDFIENIRTYADDLDVLLLYDNSPESHQEVIEAALGGRAHYVWNGGRNRGGPCAFNGSYHLLRRFWGKRFYKLYGVIS